MRYPGSNRAYDVGCPQCPGRKPLVVRAALEVWLFGILNERPLSTGVFPGDAFVNGQCWSLPISLLAARIGSKLAGLGRWFRDNPTPVRQRLRVGVLLAGRSGREPAVCTRASARAGRIRLRCRPALIPRSSVCRIGKNMEPQDTQRTAVPYRSRTMLLISRRGLPKLSSRQRCKPVAFR